MISLPGHRILTAILVLTSSCSAATNTSPGGSGQSIFNTIPNCARQCVDDFIKYDYTTTACSPSDSNCLCRTQTSSGLTLGEGAYTCVWEHCPQTVKQSSHNIYYLCYGVPGALPETHTQLYPTLSFTAQSTNTSDTTTTQQTGHATTTSFTTSEHTSTTSHSSETSTSSSISPVITSYRAPPISTSSSPAPSSSFQPATGKKKDHQTISPGAVIGASVVSGVAGCALIGLGVFFYCKKWRRDNYASSDSDSFEIGGAMSEPPGFSQPSSRRPSPDPHPGSPSRSIAGVLHERARSPGTVQMDSKSLPPIADVSPVDESEDAPGHELIGVALSSDSEYDTSSGTQSSQHTLAELLPDRTSRLYPKPLKWSHRPPSGETLFEEEEESQPVARKVSNTGSQRAISPNMMSGLPSNPRAVKDGFPAEKFLRVAGHHKTQPTQATEVDPRRCTAWPMYQERESPAPNTSDTTHDPSESINPPSRNPRPFSPSTTARGRVPSGMTSRKPIPPPKPTALSPNLGAAMEIVSRPRIVRRDDIKRVEIRPGQRRRARPSSEVIAQPYDPEDLWLERGRTNSPTQQHQQRFQTATTPYPSDASPGAVLYPPSPKKNGQLPRPPPPPSERIPSASRNLTPSRRGQDLILRVD